MTELQQEDNAAAAQPLTRVSRITEPIYEDSLASASETRIFNPVGESRVNK